MKNKQLNMIQRINRHRRTFSIFLLFVFYLNFIGDLFAAGSISSTSILSKTYKTSDLFLYSVSFNRKAELAIHRARNIASVAIAKKVLEKNLISLAKKSSIKTLKSSSTLKNKQHKAKAFKVNKAKLFGGGPGAPEASSFTTPNNDNLVNLATGDFSYNIPLLDVGGYPISINYNSNVSANEEASWVGLGWNLNAGSVNRTVRGLPDDFNGTKMYTEVNLKDKVIVSAGVNGGIELFGVDAAANLGLNLSIGIENDSYEGMSTNIGLGVSARAGGENFGGSIGLDLGINSSRGMSYGAKLGLSGNTSKEKRKTSYGGYIGLSGTSREGLKSIGHGANISESRKVFNKDKERMEYTSNGGFGSGFNHSFSTPSFTPPSKFQFNNESGGGKISFGGEVSGANAFLGGDFNYSKQSLRDTEYDQKSYGYLYSHNAGAEAVHDYNRANEGIYFREHTTLPITAFTFDLYNVSADGLSTAFRPKRNDIGVLHNAETKNTTVIGEGGVDLGFGNVFKLGIDGSGMNGEDKDSKWITENGLQENLIFKEKIENKPEYEAAYFYDAGELTPIHNEDKYRLFNENKAVTAVLDQNKLNGQLSNGNDITPNAYIYNEARKIRNKMMSYRTLKELEEQGEVTSKHYKVEESANRDALISSIESYLTESPSKGELNEKLNDLIGDITILNESGVRYHFGLPAYNNFIKEATFRINKSQTDNGLVEYENSNYSINNNIPNTDYYYLETTTPMHAYTWYITDILSPDYSDVSLNGPTPDDLGSYTALKYKKVHHNFLWRTPTEKNKATFQEGHKHNTLDNAGTVIFGGKEIYYIDTIYTRNYTATFHTSRRSDAKGVKGKHGEIDPDATLHRLDSIRLLARFANGTNEIIPIKTVHFSYNYSLCKTPGKLTLTGIAFKYANSNKGLKSGYTFEYGYNPNYHPKKIDRWGNYKSHIEEDKPYTNQDTSKQNQDAAAWLLTKINTPQGGSMEVNYESDMYAYVQNKRATIMYNVIGCTNTISERFDSVLVIKQEDAFVPKQYLITQIPKSFFNSIPENHELASFFEGINQLFFSARVPVIKDNIGPEDVKGFIPVNFSQSDYGVKYGMSPIQNDDKNYLIWIKLPVVAWNDNGLDFKMDFFPSLTPRGVNYLHPFTLAGREFISIEKPSLIKNYPIADDLGKALKNFGSALGEVFQGGVKNYLHNQGRSTVFDPSNTYIRLNHPNYNKLGGGARVKSIIQNDNWASMHKQNDHGQSNAQYGTIYDYDIKLDNGKSISSGVASYEPIMGKEENAMVLPVANSSPKVLSINANNYHLEPLGEIFYPAPQVIYSKVTSRNLPIPGVKKHGTGYGITEYFTAKDFPTIYSHTPKIPHGNQEIIPTQFVQRSESWEAASQGFVVELNNMHGQLKKHSEFDENGNLITYSENIYKDDGGNRINSKALTIDPKTLEASEKTIGLDYDIIVDANHSHSKLEGGGAQVNTDFSFAGIWPLISIIPFPELRFFYTDFRSKTITKVITRVGILDKVVSYKLGAITTNRTVAYDANTGAPLITEIDNEFEQKYYTVSLPAHWAYPAMGQASKNQGLHVETVSINDTKFNLTNADKLFFEGDELVLTGDVKNIAWVTRVSGNTVFLIDAKGGNIANGASVNIYVRRSGNKNILGASVGSFITQDHPIQNGKLNLNTSTKVLSATANTFSDYWQTSNPVVSRREFPTTCSLSIDHVGPNGLSLDRLSQIVWDSIKSNKNKNRLEIDIDNCNYTISTQTGLAFGFPYEDCDESKPVILGLKQGRNSCENQINGLQGIYCHNLIYVTSDCIHFITNHHTPPPIIDCSALGTATNPFINGILGNYRADKSYEIVTKRTEGNIREAGFLESYQPFWIYDPSTGRLIKNTNTTALWQRGDEVRVVDSRGHSLESLNPLNIPTGATYQFGNSLMSATAVNASYTDIAVDGFEEYKFDAAAYQAAGIEPSCRIKKHFNFDESLLNSGHIELSKEQVHSGNYSLKLNNNTPVEYTYSHYDATLTRTLRSNRITHDGKFIFEKGDQISNFAPKVKNKYYLSAWVSVINLPDISSFERLAEININNTPFKPSGPIIDGWQQISGEFYGANEFKMELKKIGNQVVYFDDIRIQPYNSSMQSYVYTSDFYRLAASLDENNYGMYYEYDAEGKLERVNRETEIGKYTVNEIRTELPKKMN